MHLGRIEFNIVLFMDWSFASGCSPPRLSTTQLPSATDRPVFPSGRDFHPSVGAYSQAHPPAPGRGARSICSRTYHESLIAIVFHPEFERTNIVLVLRGGICRGSLAPFQGASLGVNDSRG